MTQKPSGPASPWGQTPALQTLPEELHIPAYVVAAFWQHSNGNLISIVGGVTVPAKLEGEDFFTSPKLKMLPTVNLLMSPQAAKDLWLILGDSLAQYEQSFGEIQTGYSRQRKAN